MKEFLILAITSFISFFGINVDKNNQITIQPEILNTSTTTEISRLDIKPVDKSKVSTINSVTISPTNQLPPLPKIPSSNTDDKITNEYINYLMLIKYQNFLKDIESEKNNISIAIDSYTRSQQSSKDRMDSCTKTRSLELGMFEIESSKRMSELRNSLALRGTLGVSTQANKTLEDAQAKEDTLEKSIQTRYETCLLYANNTNQPSDYVQKLTDWKNKIDKYKQEIGSLNTGDHLIFFSKLSNFYTELNNQINYRKSFSNITIDNKDFINHIIQTTENLKQSLNNKSYFTCKQQYSSLPGINRITGYNCGDMTCKTETNGNLTCK